MRIRVMIVEDERLAVEDLCYMLQAEQDIEIVAIANDGATAWDLFLKEPIDLVFLDIEMPGQRGTEVAKRLAAHEDAPYIIFTTAYEEYALEAFAIAALDYLLKPYDRERLQQALQRVRRQMNYASRRQEEKCSNLLLEEGEKLIVVKPESILYAVKDERCVVVYTESRAIRTKWSLAELEKKLAGHPFVRSHRSYLVNLTQVKELEPWFNGTYNLILHGKEQWKVPVSRASAKDVLQRLNA